MVFFSCDGCGSMLKKNQVDVHANKCRKCHSVSCVDCSVSFFEDDYRQHTSCISEAERYEKTVYKGGKNSKKSPQEAWMELISNSASTAPPAIQSYMEALAMLDNVPRKQKQFRNFTANSLRLGHSQSVVDGMWDHLSGEREKQQAAKKQAEELQQKQKEKEKAEKSILDDHLAQAEKDSGKTGEKKNKKQKSKEASVKSPEETTEIDKLSTKRVKKTMKHVLKKAPNRSLKFKLLRQAVHEKLGLDKRSEKRLKKMLKEVASANIDEIQVDGKVVTLV